MKCSKILLKGREVFLSNSSFLWSPTFPRSLLEQTLEIQHFHFKYFVDNSCIMQLHTCNTTSRSRLFGDKTQLQIWRRNQSPYDNNAQGGRTGYVFPLVLHPWIFFPLPQQTDRFQQKLQRYFEHQIINACVGIEVGSGHNLHTLAHRSGSRTHKIHVRVQLTPVNRRVVRHCCQNLGVLVDPNAKACALFHTVMVYYMDVAE